MSDRPPAQQEESDKTVASPLTPRHHARSFARTTRTRNSKLDFPVGGILTEAPHPQPPIPSQAQALWARTTGDCGTINLESGAGLLDSD